MKLRNHIPPVVCLMVALASLFGGSAAVAQLAYPVTPFMPPARQSLVCGRFYIQTGVQFRNLQRWGFQKSTRQLSYNEPVQDPHNPGVYYIGGRPSFGPNQEGNFGTGTGVPGYTEFGLPPGNPVWGDATPGLDPRRTGIWNYDDGAITPIGFAVANNVAVTLIWPEAANPDSAASNAWGLGHYHGSLGIGATTVTDWESGIFNIANASQQVGTGSNVVYPGQPNQIGFDPAHPPAMNTTFNIFWHRVIDDTVASAGELGTPSKIWKTWTGAITDGSNREELWTPSVEMGFQWSNLFDFFYAFSWFDLEKTLYRQFVTQAELWRRAFQDTFPFESDQDVNWLPFSFASTTFPSGGTSGQRQILVDAKGTGGYPTRSFYEKKDLRGPLSLGYPPVTVTETVVARTDATVYENKIGARSWTPLYGMGRFGVTAGTLVNVIYFKTALTSLEAFTSTFFPPPSPPAPPSFPVTSTSVTQNGWLMSYGVFTGVDVEIDYNNYFFKTNAQYSISEEKQLQGSRHVWTNLNLSGFSSLVAAGVRF